MNAKQIKNLAEAHVFTDKKLTDEEYNILTESKYAHLVKKRGKFDEIFENTLPSEDANNNVSSPRSRRRFSGFNLGVNKGDVDHLIDMIEDHFNLGIDNTSTKKHMNVNVEELKNFILKHGDVEGFDKGTDERIHHIINRPNADVYSIMKGLYSLGH